MNEVQLLKWIAIGIFGLTTLSVMSTWIMLFFLRRKIRHHRELRRERENHMEHREAVGTAR